MSSEPTTTIRLPGVFVTVDGPGGVGKSTAVDLITQALDDQGIPVHVTTEPSHTPLGELIRHGTYTYRGMALACLVAGDRHHHLTSEVLPALREGRVVLCDRYLPSSLVLQRLDGIPTEVVWQLNRGSYVPDMVVLLNADPDIIAERLHSRGGHSRFEAQPGGSHAESGLYHQAAAELLAAGWPVTALDCTVIRPETISQTIAVDILHLYSERSEACPA